MSKIKLKITGKTRGADIGRHSSGYTLQVENDSPIVSIYQIFHSSSLFVEVPNEDIDNYQLGDEYEIVKTVKFEADGMKTMNGCGPEVRISPIEFSDIVGPDFWKDLKELEDALTRVLNLRKQVLGK